MPFRLFLLLMLNCFDYLEQWCLQVYSGLQSRVGLINHVTDGFSWTLLKCIHDDQKVHSAQRFALKAECNSRLAVALTIMEECFLSMVDPRTGINMIPQVLYNWGSAHLFDRLPEVSSIFIILCLYTFTAYIIFILISIHVPSFLLLFCKPKSFDSYLSHGSFSCYVHYFFS